MLTSTPQTNLRKSVLLRDATNISSPMRRRLSNVVHKTPIAQPAVDDDLERSSRRNEADIQRRVSNISATHSPLPSNEKEIQDHFQICLKMYAENKISVKNAWNLKIIDYMRVMLYSKGLAKDSLQIAGTSLDVSTKIYGIRVDDIHSDGLKLANNMARVKQPNESETTEDGEAPEDQDKENEGPKRKKKPKRMMSGPKMTICKDPKTLLGDVVKLESIFFQTRMNLDSSSSDNLFTNKLPMHPSGYKFMLLSKEQAWTSYDKVDQNIKFGQKYPFDVSKMNNLQICAPFADFEIDEWDPEHEDQLLPQEKPTITEEVVFDSEGNPIPELDGSVHDLFADGDAENHYMSSEEEEIEGVQHAAIQNKTVTHIVDFKPEENDICFNGFNEYSYTSSVDLIGNKRITQVWAGPSHWKLKHIRRTTSRFSGQQEKQIAKPVRKTKVQPTLMDFFADIPNFDKTKIYKSKRCRVDEDPFKCTLPQILPSENHLYRSLMIKPVFIRKDIPRNGENVIENEVQPYNYENPNDSQYCSQNGIMDDDHEPLDDSNFQNENEIPQNFLGENLVNAPELVPKTYIPYALQAKKMDMKKLKTAVWKSLVSEKPNELIPDEDMYHRKVQNTTFSNMYKQLPSRITDKMKQELSSPLAFVALLHLANEQNLKFTGQSDLKDFRIEQQTHFIK